MSIKKCETVKQRIAVTFLAAFLTTFLATFLATFLSTFLTTFLAECVGLKHDIATVPVLKCVL